MILNNFLNHRKPQPGSIFLPVTYERLEKSAADFLRNTRAIVGDSHPHTFGNLFDLDFDSPRIVRDRFAGIDQQIVKHAFELFRIKPSLRR